MVLKISFFSYFIKYLYLNILTFAVETFCTLLSYFEVRSAMNTNLVSPNIIGAIFFLLTIFITNIA